MNRTDFAIFLSKLNTQNRTSLIVQENVIFVEMIPGKNRMLLSMKIFDEDAFSLLKIRESFSFLGFLKWQERGAYLKLDRLTDTLFLIQEIESFSGYTPFKYVVSDFVTVANEWKEILESFV